MVRELSIKTLADGPGRDRRTSLRAAFSDRVASFLPGRQRLGQSPGVGLC